MQTDLRGTGAGDHRGDGLTLLCDGNNLAHRANHALKGLGTTASPVSAIYGVMLSLRAAVKRFEPDRIVVAWDSGKSIFRNKLYPEYKAQRNTDDEEKLEERRLLQAQMSKLKSLLFTLGVTQVAIPGVEADDLICVAAAELPGDKIILSCDRDFCQLVSDRVSLYYLTKQTLVTPANCASVFGLTPQQYLHKRLLMGDESDNITGIRGIGEKTAEVIVRRAGSSDYADLLKHYDWLMSNRRTAAVLGDRGREIIDRNRKLMDLRYDYTRKKAAIWPKIHLNNRPPDFHEFRKLLVQHNFASLLRTYNEWVALFGG